MGKTRECGLTPADDEVVDLEPSPDRHAPPDRVRIHERVGGEAGTWVEDSRTRSMSAGRIWARGEVGNDHPIRQGVIDDDIRVRRRWQTEPALARRRAIGCKLERDPPQRLVSAGKGPDGTADAGVEGNVGRRSRTIHRTDGGDGHGRK